MFGYLHGTNTDAQGLLLKVELSILNQPVLAFYQYVIMAWLSAYRGYDWSAQFIDDLVMGNIAEFQADLHSLGEHTFSFHELITKTVNVFIMGSCSA